ncbi:MAG: hypothetical protein ABSH49_20400 [Bryobacteraceae bacterium]|jgi:hypothetical protein
MKKHPDEDEVHPLHELCPSLTPEQLDQAEDNLQEYVSLALRIYERIRNDKAAYEQFRALTAADKEDTIHPQPEKLPDDSTPLP